MALYNNIDIPKKTQQMINQIQNNSTDSSVSLAQHAIKAFIDLFNNDLPIKNNDLKKIIFLTGIKLVKSQPEMAIMINFVNTIFNEIKKTKNVNETIEKVKKICQKYDKELILTNEKISINANKIIKNNYSILTHSFSQTILTTLKKAFDLGKNINIYVTESRPKLEGFLLAKQLLKYKIPTTLIVDAAVYEILPKIDLIIIGADKISNSYVINKIGTYGIALSAKQMNKQCCILCGTQKFINTDKKIKINYSHNPSEIIKTKPKQLKIHNIYFDSTPLNYFSKIITEKGIIIPKNLKQQIKSITINPKLQPYI